MRNTDFKAKLALLQGVKPREDWVSLTKSQIMADQPKLGVSRSPISGIVDVFRFMGAKPALVIPALAFLVIGGMILQISAETLPGDALYPVRAAVERAQLAFLTPDVNKAEAQIELAQNRLNDLRRAAETNKVRNLASAIEAFEANVSEASKEIQSLVENQPEKALQAGIGIVQLQKDKGVVEQILGTAIGQESGELESAVQLLVESELVELSLRSLTEEQQELLTEAESAYAEGAYETALERIWMIANTN